MRARVAAALALSAALALAGCGTTAGIVAGGSVTGPARTVYSVLPHPADGPARDMVLGEKLALQQAGGRAGRYIVSFVSLDEAAPDPGGAAARAAVVTEQAIRDPQIAAIIGPARSSSAMVAIPLVDAAGILELLPGAGYPGFTGPGALAGEPARWRPSGRAHGLARLVPDDRAQARALVRAAREAGARRIAIEREPGVAADALAAAIRSAARDEGARVVSSGAQAVVYAGEDPERAARVASAAARSGRAVVLPDAVVLAGVQQRLDRGARRRTILVSSAPALGSAAVRALRARFTAAFGRAPGPYAVTGYEAMRAVLAALAASDRDGRRQAVAAALRPPPQRAFTAYRADGRALR